MVFQGGIGFTNKARMAVLNTKATRGLAWGRTAMRTILAGSRELTDPVLLETAISESGI